MGCRLPKLRKAEEKRSPGNIYSTLRRPQVETKVGVTYTYHFLDFMLGKEEVPVSSVLCLSSVRELPVQVRELYSQGFVLVAVHPFVHPGGPRHAHIQRQLHRAVLVRETPSPEKSHMWWGRHRLETDVCVAGHQSADPEVIQSYVKRIQDMAEQGVMFVGFLQQPGGVPCILGNWDPEELSSLHSSPSPIHRHPFSANTSPTEPTELHQNNREPHHNPLQPQELGQDDVQLNKPLLPIEPDFCPLKPVQALEPRQEESKEQVQLNPEESLESSSQPSEHRQSTFGHTDHWCPNQATAETPADQLSPSPSEAAGIVGPQRKELPDLNGSTEGLCNRPNQRVRKASISDSWLSSPELDERKSSSAWTGGGVTTHNNNHIRLRSSEKDRNSSPTDLSAPARMQLFALYNHSGPVNTSLRFYSLRVPLRIQKEAGLVTEVDTHWLDHLTQHFINGAHLIDGFFLLEDGNENGVSSVDSVFIFQSSAEETFNVSYDAIVVEQWTVVDGVVVKADYVPLLQSLAPYGWRLMCVLPTPIVKTNSDGSLSTKQILFLQRPVLHRRRKDFKFQMLNLRGGGKARKKSTEWDGENGSPVMETEMDRLRNMRDEEEERKIWHSGVSPKNGAEEERRPKGLSFLPGNKTSAEEEEEETDIDEVQQPKQKSVRWTDVCHRDGGGGGGVKKEVKMEERIKQQLFSGVC